MEFPQALSSLIIELKKFPGIGTKSATRIMMYLFKNRFKLESITNSLSQIRNLSNCLECGAICEESKCLICTDPLRDQSKLMIIEDYIDLITVEKTKSYNGRYLILNGLISPLNGIKASDLNIASMVTMVNKLLLNNKSLEIIFSLNQNLEGESTIMYCKQLLLSSGVNVVFSKLATGLPKGSDIEYIDEDTLISSLTHRANI